MNGMNKALKAFILKRTMPFLDDAYIIICVEELKDEIVHTKKCQEILADHRVDCKKILTRLEKNTSDYMESEINVWNEKGFGCDV